MIDPETKLEHIQEWAEEHPKFNTDVVDGISDWICEHDMTENQEEAIDNIYEKFRVAQWIEKNRR